MGGSSGRLQWAAGVGGCSGRLQWVAPVGGSSCRVAARAFADAPRPHGAPAPRACRAERGARPPGFRGSISGFGVRRRSPRPRPSAPSPVRMPLPRLPALLPTAILTDRLCVRARGPPLHYRPRCWGRQGPRGRRGRPGRRGAEPGRGEPHHPAILCGPGNRLFRSLRLKHFCNSCRHWVVWTCPAHQPRNHRIRVCSSCGTPVTGAEG